MEKVKKVDSKKSKEYVGTKLDEEQARRILGGFTDNRELKSLGYCVDNYCSDMCMMGCHTLMK